MKGYSGFFFSVFFCFVGILFLSFFNGKRVENQRREKSEERRDGRNFDAKGDVLVINEIVFTCSNGRECY